MDKLANKKQRVLLLAILLAIVLLFWSKDFLSSFLEKSKYSGPPASIGGNFALTPNSPGFGFGNGEAQLAENPLKNYPAPEKFRSVRYEPSTKKIDIGARLPNLLNVVTTASVIEFSDICKDTYYAVLVFPIGIDYRKNPNFALYNSANSCVKGEELRVSIDFKSIAADTGKVYYYFIADQGREGIWYNPR